MSNPFLQLARDPTVPTYKQGILARKMHHDVDGKKSECLLLGGASVGGCAGWLCSGTPAVCMVGDRQPMFLP